MQLHQTTFDRRDYIRQIKNITDLFTCTLSQVKPCANHMFGNLHFSLCPYSLDVIENNIIKNVIETKYMQGITWISGIKSELLQEIYAGCKCKHVLESHFAFALAPRQDNKWCWNSHVPSQCIARTTFRHKC